MNFELNDLDLYDEYLTFVRRMIIDEYGLGIENPYDLNLEIAEKLKSGMKFIFATENGSWIYEAIDYDKWYIMKLRDERLNQLGL
jgi:hypothetical protein